MEILLPNEYNNPAEVFELWKFFRREVIACLKKTPAEILPISPEEGRWSISEVAEHLYLTQLTLARSFPIVMAKKFGEDFNGYENELDYPAIRSRMMSPTKIKNPPSVGPLNKYTYEELIPLLNSSEEKMESFIKKYNTKEKLITRGLTHPVFGILNIFDYLWLMSLHEKSHLTSLEERTKNF